MNMVFLTQKHRGSLVPSPLEMVGRHLPCHLMQGLCCLLLLACKLLGILLSVPNLIRVLGIQTQAFRLAQHVFTPTEPSP